ncbi:hypothetical protein DF186_14290 [Enterococcus hirae]|nr:hypothetical protein DF186_14290 [Enterococcus hirae]
MVVLESMDNGKLICEICVVDVLFVIDYFCYFVGCIWVEEGGILMIDVDIIVYYFCELFGVVG